MVSFLKANQNLSADEHGNIGQVATGAIMTLIVVGVLGIVGLAIMDGIQENSPVDANSSFYETQTNFIAGITSAFGMSGTLLLVIIAVAIVGIVIRLAM